MCWRSFKASRVGTESQAEFGVFLLSKPMQLKKENIPEQWDNPKELGPFNFPDKVP